MNAKYLIVILLLLMLFLSVTNCRGQKKTTKKKKSRTTKKPRFVINVNLPCEYFYDSSFGYTCKVDSDYEILNNDMNIFNTTGQHIPVNKNLPRYDYDVFRVIFYDINIFYLPDNITTHFPKLKTLQVKKCGLKALTKGAYFNILRRMYLGFNEIKEIPMTYFWHFCRLEILSLHGNQISTIPQMAFRDLINLKRLSLNHNQLMSIDPLLFVRSLNLEYIDLDNNALQIIEGDLFAKLTKLLKINMRNNSISYIGSDFLSNNTNVIAIFENNRCTDFSLPDDGTFEVFRAIIENDCSIRPNISTTPKPPPTLKPRKKPKYKPKQKLYFDYCEWHIQKGFFKVYPNIPNFKLDT